MYIRVTRGRFDPAKAAAVDAATPDIVTAVKALPGFRGYQGGLDRAAGTVLSITLWDDEAAANYPRQTLAPVAARLAELGVRLEAPQIVQVSHTA